METSVLNFYLKETLISTAYDVSEEHIKAVERIFRNSFEYKKYIHEKRTGINGNSCSYLKDFDFSKNQAKLELHHHITLFDLVSLAYKVLLSENKKGITTSDVSSLITEWHYRNYIPYVFLSKTMHELYHSKQYTYELSAVMGNPLELYNKYKHLMTSEMDKQFKEVIQCQKVSKQN